MKHVHFMMCLLLLCISSKTLSQKKGVRFKFGDVKAEDFAPTVYPVDSSAYGVYLYDVGKSNYIGNNKGGLSVVYERHARIRLLNKNSFDDLATLKVPLVDFGFGYTQKIEDLDAATYNLENGQVVTTKVDKSMIFKDKEGDVTYQKFTFPNIKEGSIIEYDLKVSTPTYRYLEDWYFQGGYPRLWSEYDIEIPEFYNFVFLPQGYQPYVIDSTNITTDNFSFTDPGENAMDRLESYSFRSNTIEHLWAMKDVPALKDEGFTTTLDNHVAKIEFQLSSVRYPNQSVRPIMQSWLQITEELMKDEDFGEALTHNNGWLSDDVKKATAGVKDSIEMAKKIFGFVRDNYNCTDNTAKYLSQNLKKVYQAKKGNVADINILLTAMLLNAGFESHPVLLSTRSHGKSLDIYPLMGKFNYVISQVIIGGSSYLLDASNTGLGFGKLSQKCYNGGARVIGPLPALIELSADSLHETKLTTVFMINAEDGKNISASFSTQLGTQESAEFREDHAGKSTDDYFKDTKKAYSFEVEISNAEINALKMPDEPVTVKYDMKFNFGDDDIIYFSPLLAESYKENPFKSAERIYPVEMPYCSEETYILNMEVPKGYTVEELPKSARVMLNENEGMFEYIIAAGGGRIQLRCRTQIKKANFAPEDYQTLRDFFAFIVKKEAEQIVFKKQ